MDTSKVYIKMCDCDEVQDPKRESGLVDGDYFYTPSVDKWGIVHEPTRALRYWMMGLIWIPRQDQIQEMVGDCNNPYPIVERFYEYALNPRRLGGSGWIMLSMEQLWIAFYMKEKHGLNWNGEKWE